MANKKEVVTADYGNTRTLYTNTYYTNVGISTNLNMLYAPGETSCSFISGITSPDRIIVILVIFETNMNGFTLAKCMKLLEMKRVD